MAEIVTIGDATLYLGDCMDILPTLPKVDAVITDPPYGTTACKWDSVIAFDPMWELLNRIINPNGAIILFGSEPFSSLLRISNLEMYKYDWYWEKERLTNIHQVKKRAGKTVETISVFYTKQCKYNPQMQVHTGSKRSNKVKNGVIGGLSDNKKNTVNEYNDSGLRYPTQVIRFKRDVLTSNLHPTQKPIFLMEYLVKTYTNECETVLDFTMGSGTTGVAAIQMGRKFIGIEREPKYFDIACKRIEQATKQENMFIPKKQPEQVSLID